MAEKKKFFPVEIPLLDEKITLIANNLEQLNNRTIKLDLTRILKGKSLEAIIKVNIKDGKALGEVRKILLLPFFIRRMMRKSISYVEDSFSADAEDAILKIKFFLITRKKVHRAVRSELRIQAKKYLEEYVKEKSNQEIFAEILGNRLQKSLSLKLKKIYPLALCEIRDIKIEKDKEVIEKVKEEKPDEKKEEKVETTE